MPGNPTGSGIDTQLKLGQNFRLKAGLWRAKSQSPAFRRKFYRGFSLVLIAIRGCLSPLPEGLNYVK